MTTRRRTRPALRQHPDRQGRGWGGRGALDDLHHEVEPVRSPVTDVGPASSFPSGQLRTPHARARRRTLGRQHRMRAATPAVGPSGWGSGSGTATSAPDRRGRPPRCPARPAAAPTPIPMSSWNPPCRAALVNNDAIRSCASGTEGSTARVPLPPPSRMGRACRSIQSAAYTRVQLDTDALWDIQRQTQRRIPLSDNASPAANR